ncbi:hypothetical protein [Rhizobium leguminosarum]|uniref:HNH endonuclease n=1 Tax=Rhizobium leguminosarum TaxID=384 RepID=UPI001C984E14|nr:hypothetical protein [Rhizobium leguminosarum]MBY5708067.1 hypothetical protein [Rhizobium leguminosarum]
MAELFAMLDDEWEGLQPYLGGTFTTQTFRSALEHNAPHAWAKLVERYGPGGKGSGKFYSPSNILYNYLNDKARNSLIIRRGFVPSEKGWGTRIVIQWQIADAVAPATSEEDKKFIEGREERRQHLFRERKAGLRQELLSARKRVGLSCDICELTGSHLAKDISESVFEAHHNKEPFSTPGERTVTVKDMALLCANCHRLLHRLVTLKGRWFEVEEARLEFGFEFQASSA